MVDQKPSFKIYHDPPDEDLPSTKPPTQHSTRLVLSEIKLPNWGPQTRRGSALKHELLASEPETSSTSSQPENLPSGPSSEESKENFPSGPLKPSPSKKSRTFPTPGLKCKQTPLSTSISPTILRLRQQRIL